MDEQDLSKLRVAIVHYWLTGMRGGERVVESLCRIFPQADIYTHVVRREALSETILAHPIHTTFIQKLPGSVRHYQKYLPLMPLALEQLDLRAYDLVISSESGPAKGVITRADTPHICYCHSPMRYLWDFYQDYLESTGPLTRLLMRPVFHRLRLWDFASAQRVDHVIANSCAVQRRIKRWWGKESTVIHPPVDVSAFSRPDMSLLRTLPGQPEPSSYYLCLGQLVSYKRVDLAVRACTITGRQLIVSGEGPERKRLEKMAGPTVHFVGRLPHTVLPALYAGCRAFLFPGEEDFGITPLEAAAAGRPVIAYGRGGVLDSVREGETGLFFGKQDVTSLVEALERFERIDGSTWSAERLRAQASLFSEERFLEELSAFIQHVLEEQTDQLSQNYPGNSKEHL